VKHPWDATDDIPEITSLVPYILLITEPELMHCKMVTLKADLMSIFESMLIVQLDQHKVNKSGFAWGKEIVQKLETLLGKVWDVSGTKQVSPGVTTLAPHDDLTKLGESGRFI
jgi:hypothetical protein